MYVLIISQLGLVGLCSLLSIFYYQIKLSFNSSSNYTNDNSIVYDNDKNTIYIIENEGQQRIPFKSNTSKFIILDISNNDSNKLLYNSTFNTWSISGEEYRSMIFNKSGISYKKFHFFVKDNNIINNEISNNIIEFDPLDFSSNGSDILIINANATLKLLNKNPGDIETRNYSFGIYSLTDNTKISDMVELVSMKNTIMVFDSSYNYSNCSLSYIYKTNQDQQPLSGITFLIKQEDDLCLNNIVVDQFNATITQS